MSVCLSLCIERLLPISLPPGAGDLREFLTEQALFLQRGIKINSGMSSMCCDSSFICVCAHTSIYRYVCASVWAENTMDGEIGKTTWMGRKKHENHYVHNKKRYSCRCSVIHTTVTFTRMECKVFHNGSKITFYLYGIYKSSYKNQIKSWKLTGQNKTRSKHRLTWDCVCKQTIFVFDINGFFY